MCSRLSDFQVPEGNSDLLLQENNQEGGGLVARVKEAIKEDQLKVDTRDLAHEAEDGQPGGHHGDLQPITQ